MRGLVLGHPSKNDRPVHNNALEVVDGGIGQEDSNRSVRRMASVHRWGNSLTFLASFSSDSSDGVQPTALLRDKLMVLKSLIIAAHARGLDRVNI